MVIEYRDVRFVVDPDKCCGCKNVFVLARKMYGDGMRMLNALSPDIRKNV